MGKVKEERINELRKQMAKEIHALWAADKRGDREAADKHWEQHKHLGVMMRELRYSEEE